MATPFLAEVRMVGFNFAPVGWAACDGQLMAIDQNPALFAIIGTTYGGDGQVTFGLPNLQGRVPLHMGQGPGLSSYLIGQFSGESVTTLTSTQVPAHIHMFQGVSGAANSSDPTGKLPASNRTTSPYSVPAAASAMSPNAIAPAGGGQPHNNMQPYLSVMFIIALQGIFPSPP